MKRHQSVPDIRAGEAVNLQHLPDLEGDPLAKKVMDPAQLTPQTISDHVPMDTSKAGEDRVKLDPIIAQCSNARKATSKIEAAAITLDENFGKRFVVEQDIVGTLNPPGDREILRTYHGARISRGSTPINQVVSMTMDPATLKCVVCKDSHNIFKGNEPGVIMFSDQNFIPIWPEEKGECVPIVRVLDPSLSELGDLAMELLDCDPLPAGSVILIGSVSYLHKVGIQSYCHYWTKLVSRIGKRWPNINVGPLIPIIREKVPGGVAREVVEFAAWLARVYAGVVHGMSSSWGLVTIKVMELAVGHTQLANVETYTVSLPTGLDPNLGSTPLAFCANSSRSSILNKMDQEQIDGLLDAVSGTLGRELSIDVRINAANVKAGGDIQARKVILVGASVLKRAGECMAVNGTEVVDLCVPGWSITPDNVRELTDKLKGLDVQGPTVVVMDLFGNSVFRYIDYDGTESRPFKQGGGFHMPGEVTVVGADIMSKLLEMVMPILDAVPGQHYIVVAPPPRYLFYKCCGNESHCTNVSKDTHPGLLLSKTMAVRLTLKNALVHRFKGKIWITDTCDVLPEPAGLSIADRVEALRDVCGTDGVHFNQEGYVNLATNVMKSANDLLAGRIGNGGFKRPDTASVFSGSSRRFNWHGFSSPVGSERNDSFHGSWKSDRSRSKFTPYQHSRKPGWRR